MSKPLDGVQVLDISRILAGPLTTQWLADLGADVIKIERPGTGDDSRLYGPPFLDTERQEGGGMSGFYLSCNRYK
jgi:crotonobetainyl-CoA:carnitine CoA-transferase CaiB-like acyl-CoA transferase